MDSGMIFMSYLALAIILLGRKLYAIQLIILMICSSAIIFALLYGSNASMGGAEIFLRILPGILLSVLGIVFKRIGCFLGCLTLPIYISMFLPYAISFSWSDGTHPYEIQFLITGIVIGVIMAILSIIPKFNYDGFWRNPIILINQIISGAALFILIGVAAIIQQGFGSYLLHFYVYPILVVGGIFSIVLFGGGKEKVVVVFF